MSAVNSEGRGDPAVLVATTLRGLFSCEKVWYNINFIGILSLDFPTMFSISEGALPGSLDSRLFFGMTGTSEDTVSFSLVPLTYLQFEAITGQQVTSIFSSVPFTASEGEILLLCHSLLTVFF